jgi:hypothetical protein
VKRFICQVFPAIGALLAIAYLWRSAGHIWGAESMPVDQAIQYWNINDLLAGENYLVKHVHTSYPPSYLLLLSPLFLFSYQTAIPVWAASNLAGGLILIALLSWGNRRRAGVLFGAHAWYQTIGIGQFGVFPMLAAVSLKHTETGVRRGAVITYTVAAVFLAGKISIGLPLLFWMLLHKHMRTSVLIAAGIHLSLLFWAASLMDLQVVEMMALWVKNQGQTGQTFLGKNDLFLVLGTAGVPAYLVTPIGFVVSAIAAYAVYRTILSEAAAAALLLIAARLIFYHNDYDNLMLLPALSLIWQGSCDDTKPGAGFDKARLLLAATMALSLWLPARLLDTSTPAGTMVTIMQALVWITSAAVLVNYDRMSRRASLSSSPK